MRTKAKNSSRPSMDRADKIMKAELYQLPDRRWKYELAADGSVQRDADIARRAGCNPTYVSSTRKRKYGPLAPSQTEESRAAKRGKMPPQFAKHNAMRIKIKDDDDRLPEVLARVAILEEYVSHLRSELGVT